MNEKQKKTLLMGCGLGCGVLTLVVIILVIVIAVAIPGKLKAKAPVLAQSIQRDYDDMKSRGQVPADSAADYDALVKLSQETEPTFWGFLIIKSMVDEHLADGKISPEEKAAATELTEYIKANPGMGFFKFKAYVEKHPDLQKALQNPDPKSLGF